MFCQKCGKELEPGTMFCPECGTSVSSDAQPAAAAAMPVAPAPVAAPVAEPAVPMVSAPVAAPVAEPAMPMTAPVAMPAAEQNALYSMGQPQWMPAPKQEKPKKNPWVWIIAVGGAAALVVAVVIFLLRNPFSGDKERSADGDVQQAMTTEEAIVLDQIAKHMETIKGGMTKREYQTMMNELLESVIPSQSIRLIIRTVIDGGDVADVYPAFTRYLTYEVVSVEEVSPVRYKAALHIQNISMQNVLTHCFGNKVDEYKDSGPLDIIKKVLEDGKNLGGTLIFGDTSKAVGDLLIKGADELAEEGTDYLEADYALEIEKTDNQWKVTNNVLDAPYVCWGFKE